MGVNFRRNGREVVRDKALRKTDPAKSASLAPPSYNRDLIGIGAAVTRRPPATPPCVRVRTRRFEWLR